MAIVRRLKLEAWLTAVGAAGLVVYYSLRNGTYDLVVRGELSLLIWVALGVGWAVGVLPRVKPPRLLWVPVAAFLGLAIWTTIALSWTESDERTVVEIGRVVHHAGVLLLAASLLGPRTWRAALGGLTVGLVIVSWIGLCNWLWPNSIAVDDIRRVFITNRLSYPLDYFNAMATLGAMTVVACLGWATHAPNWWLRAAAAVPLPGAVVMSYLTYSRGGALELGVGLIVLLGFAWRRATTLLVGAIAALGSTLTILALRDHPDIVKGAGTAGSEDVLVYTIIAGAVTALVTGVLGALYVDDRLRLPRRIGLPALAGALVIATVATAIVTPSVVRRLGDSLESKEVGSVDNPTARFTSLGGGRLPQFRAALDAFEAHPIKGTGPGTYEFTWNRDDEYQSFVRDVHNLYIEALAESGIPGLVFTLGVMLGIAALVLLAGARAPNAPDRGAAAVALSLFAVFAVAAAVDWAWELTALPVVALVAAGAVAAGGGEGRYRSRVRPSRLVVPLVAVVGCLATLPPLVSTSELRESQAAARAGDPAEALRHADEAIDTAPWSASAMAQKGLLLESAGRLDAAEGYVILAFDREPTNWRYALLRARLLAKRGDEARAVDWFRRARALAPLKPALQ